MPAAPGFKLLKDPIGFCPQPLSDGPLEPENDLIYPWRITAVSPETGEIQLENEHGVKSYAVLSVELLENLSTGPGVVYRIIMEDGEEAVAINEHRLREIVSTHLARIKSIVPCIGSRNK